MRKFVLYILLVAFISSCKKGHWGDCFMGTGAITTEIRMVDNFTEMELYDNINVILIQGTENKIEVEAGKNLIPGIKTEITNGKLIIENENQCNFMRTYKIPINVYVTYNALTSLIHYGGGKVTCQDTLRQSFFEFQQWSGSGDFDLKVNIDTLKMGFHTGSGDADLYGKTKELSLYSAGNSIFRCSNLIADIVYINQSSTGNFTVNVRNRLYVQIYNYGDVYYYGNPFYVEPQIHSSGQLFHL